MKQKEQLKKPMDSSPLYRRITTFGGLCATIEYNEKAYKYDVVIYDISNGRMVFASRDILRDSERTLDKEQEITGVQGALSDIRFHSNSPILAYSLWENRKGAKESII